MPYDKNTVTTGNFVISEDTHTSMKTKLKPNDVVACPYCGHRQPGHADEYVRSPKNQALLEGPNTYDCVGCGNPFVVEPEQQGVTVRRYEHA